MPGRLTMLAIAVFLTLGGPAFAQDSPEAVYRKYGVAVQVGSVDECAKYLSTAMREKLLADPPEMRKKMLGIIAAGTPKAVKVTRKTIAPDAKTATLDLSGTGPGDGTPMFGKLTLVKEGADWRIQREQWSNTQP